MNLQDRNRPTDIQNKLVVSTRASWVVQMVKKPPAMRETWIDPWVGKTLWRRAWQPTPVFLPGESLWTEGPGGLQSTELLRVGHN